MGADEESGAYVADIYSLESRNRTDGENNVNRVNNLESAVSFKDTDEAK